MFWEREVRLRRRGSAIVSACWVSLSTSRMMAEGEGQPDADHELRIRMAFDIYYSRTHTATSVARDAFEDARVRSRFELLVQSSQKLANQMDAKPRLTMQDVAALHDAFNSDLPSRFHFLPQITFVAIPLQQLPNRQFSRPISHQHTFLSKHPRSQGHQNEVAALSSNFSF